MAYVATGYWVSGYAVGDSAVVVPPSGGSTGSQQGWAWLWSTQQKRDVPRRVRDELEEVAKAEVARQAALAHAATEAERRELAEANLALDAIEQRFLERDLEWREQYAALLVEMIAAQDQARREAEMRAVAAQLEAARVAEALRVQRNRNARAVLVLLSSA